VGSHNKLITGIKKAHWIYHDADMKAKLCKIASHHITKARGKIKMN
jgi:hypothetical protein